MKKFITVVILSALLILSIPRTDTPVNKSTTAKAKATTVQVQAPEKALQQEATTPTEQKAVVEPAAVEIPQTPPVPATREELMAAAGILPEDYGAADYIISKESSWNENATNPTSGAHGLIQALPYTKTGCDWSDAVCQLKWGNAYAVDRYGSWQGAHAFWLKHSWW